MSAAEEHAPFERPDWFPQAEPGARILVAGATGGIGTSLVDLLLKSDGCMVGAHGFSRMPEWDSDRVIGLQRKLKDEEACRSLVEEFAEQAGGISGIVALAGSIRHNKHWDQFTGAEWEEEIHMNLNVPFYLARAAMDRMKEVGGVGRVILNGTESALHGGSPTSFPYGIAKRGTECMIQGLAREGAKHGILVNGIRFGYITSGFHQRWQGKTSEQMADRAEMVPLKRGGDPEEAAALIVYLLSGWARFVTGQMIPLTGGDWL